jgi:peptide/nickel transport system substrate-binding protein
VTVWMRRTVVAALSTTFVWVNSLPAQGGRDRTSIVIVVGHDAPVPIPTLMEGPQSQVANFEIADHLFLRLAGLGPTLTTAGDAGFVPLLARSWTRRDSVTLAFDLDPRARWHDGVPVTSRDVLFTYERARNPDIVPKLAEKLRHIAAVSAEGDGRVVFRFTHVYAEQLYDATFHVAPLPAHLLAAMPPRDLAQSAFVSHPVGNGPYRWVRRQPGQFIELGANPRFFLGRPQVERVIVRVASDPDARINLLLSGEVDAMDNIPPPLSNIARVAADPDVRFVPVPSPNIGYLLYNQRDPRDTSRPHPILADIDVRRAITLALDRRVIVRAVLGNYGEIPFGPASSLLWIRHGAPAPAPMDREQARRLLAGRGWSDTDGDGVLDRRGQRLALTLLLPNTSGIRRQMALLAQEQLRQVGIQIELRQVEFPFWLELRSAGNFDIDFSSASQDPSPSGLTQSWSCAGSSNVAHFCDRQSDSLLEHAILTQGDSRPAWHAVLRRIEENAPAAFLYMAANVFAVNRRFSEVTIRPESSWISLWRWTIGATAQQRPAGY